MMGGMGFGMGFGWLLWLLLFVALILVVKTVFDSQSRSNAENTITKKALEILDERYARGEIDRREYEEKRRHLTAS